MVAHRRFSNACSFEGCSRCIAVPFLPEIEQLFLSQKLLKRLHPSLPQTADRQAQYGQALWLRIYSVEASPSGVR
eukprot:s1701_g9.t1